MKDKTKQYYFNNPNGGALYTKDQLQNNKPVDAYEAVKIEDPNIFFCLYSETIDDVGECDGCDVVYGWKKECPHYCKDVYSVGKRVIIEPLT